MIIVEKQALKFLLAGRKITVTARREHKKGRTYAVGVRHNRTICRALVVEVTEASDGWLLEIEHAALEPPRWLARNPGGQLTDYVGMGQRAAFEAGEAVDEATQRRLSAQGSFRWRQEHERREAERACSALVVRLNALERSNKRGADVSAELRVVRERLELWRARGEAA